MRHRESRWIGFVISAALLGGMANAGVKEGVDAWQAGNYPKAIAEWKAPAEQGDADAQFNLGQAYKLGRGVPADVKAAQMWYEKAAQQGHEQAQANLGLILFQNGDRQNAMPWIRKAADRGEPRAQYVLGTALFNGDLAPRDWPRAYALMTRAAAAGLPQASTSLQQMDQYMSASDRQAGIAIARDLEKGGKLADSTVKPAVPAVAPAPAAKSTPATKPGMLAKAPAPIKTAAPAPSAAAPEATPTPPKKPIEKKQPEKKAADGTPAKPVTAPAPPSAEKTAAPTQFRKGSWRIQLGAFGSRAAAETAWAHIAKNEALKGQEPTYTAVKTLTRLQAGPFAGKAEANGACVALRKAGANCFPVAP